MFYAVNTIYQLIFYLLVPAIASLLVLLFTSIISLSWVPTTTLSFMLSWIWFILFSVRASECAGHGIALISFFSGLVNIMSMVDRSRLNPHCSGVTQNKLRYPLLNPKIELHSRTKKISPQLLMKLKWNSWSRPIAALNIPARPRSWKALIKRFTDDGQTSSFREKQALLGK